MCPNLRPCIGPPTLGNEFQGRKERPSKRPHLPRAKKHTKPNFNVNFDACSSVMFPGPLIVKLIYLLYIMELE